MKPVRIAVIAAITFLSAMTILSAVLFAKCRCCGKRFSPYLCLHGHLCPRVGEDAPTCRDNLIILEMVKYEWASEHSASDGYEVTWDDVRPYLNKGKSPRCNQGGHYVLGLIGEEPDCIGACSLHADPLEHALEPAVLYAATPGKPLASARVLFERRRESGDACVEAPSADDDVTPPEAD